MTPRAAEIYEQYPSVRDQMDAVQYFDLSRVSKLVETMMQEYDKTFYPAMMASDLPADKVCFRATVDGETAEAYAERTETGFRCDLVEWLKESAVHKIARDHLLSSDIAARVKYANSEPEQHAEFSAPYKNDKWNHWKRGDMVARKITEHNVLPFFVSVCCDLIAQQNLFQHIEQTAPRAMRKRLAREGRNAPTHRVVDFARSQTVGCHWSDGEGPRKALHFVSGHWRRSSGPKSVEVEGERKTWIDGHWRGDPTIGIVTKTYVAGNRFIASHSEAA